jgi:putative transposon-encoded protein
MTKNKRYINTITGIVKKQGNSGHIVLPVEWIGKEVYVKLLEEAKREAIDKALKGQRIKNIK